MNETTQIGQNTTGIAFSKMFLYLTAIGTSIFGAYIDLIIMLIFDTDFLPIFSISVLLFACYRVYSNRLFEFTPPKHSIHYLVDKEEYRTLYEMFAQVAPKGSELFIYRSIGLENSKEMSFTKSKSCLYLEEDLFLRCDQDANTRSVGFCNAIAKEYPNTAFYKPALKAAWLEKLEGFLRKNSEGLEEDNTRTHNNMIKAGILGGIFGGGAAAMTGVSAVALGKTLERGPMIALLLFAGAYLVYFLAIILIMAIPYFIITMKIALKVTNIAKASLGENKGEVDSNWSKGATRYNDNLVAINDDQGFYTSDNGWLTTC